MLFAYFSVTLQEVLIAEMRPKRRNYIVDGLCRKFLVLLLLSVFPAQMCMAFRVRGSRGIAPEEYSQYSSKADYYILELGLFGGGSYYTGDATPHIFRNIRPAYGVSLRYNHTRRWSFVAKAVYSDIRFTYNTLQEEPMPEGETFVPLSLKAKNILVTADIIAEYNFFELARGWVNRSTRPFSPYVFAGLGVSWQKYGPTHVAGYLPFGIGFKWLATPRLGFNFAWQTQLQFNDKLEGVDQLNDFWELNGGNFMKNDLFSTFTLGISVNFATRKKKCNRCD